MPDRNLGCRCGYTDEQMNRPTARLVAADTAGGFAPGL